MSMNLNAKSQMSEVASARQQPQVGSMPSSTPGNRRLRSSVPKEKLPVLNEGSNEEATALLQLTIKQHKMDPNQQDNTKHNATEVTEHDILETVAMMVNKTFPNIPKNGKQLQVFSSALWTYIKNEKKQKKLTSKDIFKVHQSMRDGLLSKEGFKTLLEKLKTCSSENKKAAERMAIDIYDWVKTSDKKNVLKLNDNSDQEFKRLLSEEMSMSTQQSHVSGSKMPPAVDSHHPTQGAIAGTGFLQMLSDWDIVKDIVYWILIVICCFVICWVLVIGCCGQQNGEQNDEAEGGEEENNNKGAGSKKQLNQSLLSGGQPQIETKQEERKAGDIEQGNNKGAGKK